MHKYFTQNIAGIKIVSRTVENKYDLFSQIQFYNKSDHNDINF